MSKITSAALFAKDLMYGSQVREALVSGGVSVTPIRNDAEVATVIATSPSLLLLNLGMQGGDPFAALSAALAQGIPVWCWFSHVDEPLRERALAEGATQVYPRSQFVRRLSEFLSAQVSE